ncbi:MAG: D-amino acid aminotransferase [Lachnospiraceae bacterium]|nr:D-amino acid aminotransferase [Lachnospiraceae bacterium]
MEKLTTLGYYNGAYGPLEEMTVPMNDRVCYFGDGVYEAAYVANYNIFTLDDHIDRMYRSAALVEIEIAQTKEEMKAILRDLVTKVESPNQLLYWQVTRGTAMRNHVYPDPAVPANFWVTIKPLPVKNAYQKVKLITADDTRFFHCNIKTLNLLINCMVSEKAKRAGCDEAVLHRGDRVTECAHSNVSILKDGALCTAPTDNLILPGITRAHLIANCKKLGIPVIEEPFTLDDLRNADEVLISSSTAFVRSASEIDGTPVGGKAPELLKKIQDAMRQEFIDATGIAPSEVPDKA